MFICILTLKYTKTSRTCNNKPIKGMLWKLLAANIRLFFTDSFRIMKKMQCAAMLS